MAVLHSITETPTMTVAVVMARVVARATPLHQPPHPGIRTRPRRSPGGTTRHSQKRHRRIPTTASALNVVRRPSGGDWFPVVRCVRQLLQLGRMCSTSGCNVQLVQPNGKIEGTRQGATRTLPCKALPNLQRNVQITPLAPPWSNRCSGGIHRTPLSFDGFQAAVTRIANIAT